MSNIHIFSRDVADSIRKLKMSVSRTPDDIPSLFVKRTANNLIRPLAHLYNQSISQGSIPINWSMAIVVPIHKKGLKSNPDNYRPISLSSVFCRVLENIIHKHITLHLSINKVTSSSQHGFEKLRSTITQQHLVVDMIAENINNKVQTDMVLLDFSKAFDKVSHLKLISVLKAYGINQKVINWISCFLSTRTQETVVDNQFSSPINVTSGVIQGSVLGPLLFNIYLNSLLLKLSEVDNTNAFAFADDLKLISTSHVHLQQALHLVKDWCDKFKLELNPSKSEHISFYERTAHNFFIGANTIKKVEQVRDLGLTLTNDLKWNTHTTKITFKATSLSYIILRCFSSPYPAHFIKSYKSFIRPLLEYNTTIWNSSTITNIKTVEQVQRTFTRRLLQRLNMPFANYEDRLKILKLETLELRRLQFDLILLYKIVHKLIDVSFKSFFKPLNLSYNLRHHKFALSRQPVVKNIILNQSYKYRVISSWNNLPSFVVESKSLSTFKRNIKTVNLDKYMLQ